MTRGGVDEGRCKPQDTDDDGADGHPNVEPANLLGVCAPLGLLPPGAPWSCMRGGYHFLTRRMSALLVSEVSTLRDYWRNTAVTPTKIQSSWRRIFVDCSYHIGPFLVGWSASVTLPHYGRVLRDSVRIAGHKLV